MSEVGTWHPLPEGAKFDIGRSPIEAEAIKGRQQEILEIVDRAIAKEVKVKPVDEEGEE